MLSGFIFSREFTEALPWRYRSTIRKGVIMGQFRVSEVIHIACLSPRGCTGHSAFTPVSLSLRTTQSHNFELA